MRTFLMVAIHPGVMMPKQHLKKKSWTVTLICPAFHLTSVTSTSNLNIVVRDREVILQESKRIVDEPRYMVRFIIQIFVAKTRTSLHYHQLVFCSCPTAIAARPGYYTNSTQG